VIDIFSHIYATLKADTYFATTLSGFADASGRFKLFRDGEGPTLETPFIEVEIQDGPENQNNKWATPTAIFSVVGDDTEWDTLNTIADNIKTILQGKNCFAALGMATPVQYQIIGAAVFGRGVNPITEKVYRSVGLSFGLSDG